MTPQGIAPRSRSLVIGCWITLIVAIICTAGVILLAVLVIKGGAFGNWGGPGPTTVAIYDGLQLSSGDSGATFDSVHFRRRDVIPPTLSIKLHDGTERSLRDLADDPDEVLRLFSRRPIDSGTGHEVVGTCNLMIEIDEDGVVDMYFGMSPGKDEVILFSDGNPLVLPITRERMERVFGKDYRLKRG